VRLIVCPIPDTGNCPERPAQEGRTVLSTIAILAAGCLIDVALILLLARLTDGRRPARALYGARAAPVVWSLH
jgi:hypothetical protein